MDVEFLNIRHLRVFLEVAKSHSVSIAAGKSHLSQPAVTQAISKLESKVEVALFSRSNAGFYVTEIGDKFVNRVERALAQLQAGAKFSNRSRTDRRSGGFANFHELVTAAQLRALVAVSEARSFSVAGRSIGLSQPSLHRSVSNLEKLSGLELFRRTSTGIEPNPAGRILTKHAKLAFAELQQGLNEIAEYQGRGTTAIIVGSLPLARSQILPRAVHAMIESAPKVQIRVVDGLYSELLRGLRQGDIDCIIGALRDPEPAPDVTQQELFSDPLAIVAGPNHPLVGKDQVGIDDTLDFPWVAPPKITPGGTYLFETLQIQNLPQTPVRAVSSSMIFLRGLLAQGDYLTILSRHQIQEECALGLMVPLPIDLKDSERAIGLTTRRDWRPTELQSRFLEMLREFSRKPAENN
jgi:DNA-binding transcriptional LysR family regulator